MSSLNKTSPDIEMRKLSEFPFEYLKRNYFIDIKETSGTNWLIGRIIDLNSEENVLKVRCEGMRQELV